MMRRQWISRGNRLTVVVVGSLLVSLMAGCHSSKNETSPPSAATANAIQSIQSNPNIPPQAKANIIKQMQSKSPPTAQPGASVHQ